MVEGVRESLTNAWARALLGTALIGAAPAPDAELPLNCGVPISSLSISDLQYVTSHNSFHIAPHEAVLAFVRHEREIRKASGAAIAREMIAASYTHPTLTRQLDIGIRALEIDVHDDPLGGRFAEPKVIARMSAETVRALPSFDPDHDLAKPGFKTFHDPNYDMRSRCLLFSDCLREVAQWHRSHSGHLPIFVLVEMKVDSEPLPAGADTKLKWKRLQNAITEQFAPEELILPASLGHEPVRWPTLRAARGKLVFLLFNYGDRPAERYAEYIKSSGATALLHIELDRDGLYATWQSRNNPETIAAKSIAGRPEPVADLLLYTKADTTGVQDDNRRELALSSRANFVATDFTRPDPRRSRYSVSFGGRYVRAICPVHNAGAKSDLKG